ncbi:hypothetical protein GCM10011586_24760 [Silvibacterium dinghuense]|nr:hypothetical protein GCM10011586_24760 [Silvibacterium dinghuense]
MGYIFHHRGDRGTRATAVMLFQRKDTKLRKGISPLGLFRLAGMDNKPGRKKRTVSGHGFSRAVHAAKIRGLQPLRGLVDRG